MRPLLLGLMLAGSAGAQTIVINILPGAGPAAYGATPQHVALGASVIWHNLDRMPHTATSDSGLWATGVIAPKAASPAIIFPTAGTFPYHCEIHGVTMTGTIVVP